MHVTRFQSEHVETPIGRPEKLEADVPADFSAGTRKPAPVGQLGV